MRVPASAEKHDGYPDMRRAECLSIGGDHVVEKLPVAKLRD